MHVEKIPSSPGPPSPWPAICRSMEGCRPHPPPGTLPHPLENATRFPQPTGHDDGGGRESRTNPKLSTETGQVHVALFVSGEVQARSQFLGFPVQLPEERLGGGLADFALLRCGGKVGQILAPREGDVVVPEDKVEVQVLRRGFYLTAVLYPVSNGGYFPQHLSPAPAPAEPGSEVFLAVDYGNAIHFQVYVGFSADPQFLSGQDEVDTLPVQDAVGRTVHWLGPINVRVHNS